MSRMESQPPKTYGDWQAMAAGLRSQDIDRIMRVTRRRPDHALRRGEAIG